MVLLVLDQALSLHQYQQWEVHHKEPSKAETDEQADLVAAEVDRTLQADLFMAAVLGPLVRVAQEVADQTLGRLMALVLAAEVVELVEMRGMRAAESLAMAELVYQAQFQDLLSLELVEAAAELTTAQVAQVAQAAAETAVVVKAGASLGLELQTLALLVELADGLITQQAGMADLVL